MQRFADRGGRAPPAQRRTTPRTRSSLPKLGRVDYGRTEIVATRFDAGVRLREQVARGMIAVPISPEMRVAAVASPAYFAKHAPPKKPQELTGHCCTNIRLATANGVYVWELEKHHRG